MSMSETRPNAPPASDSGCDIGFTLQSDYCTASHATGALGAYTGGMARTVFERIIAGELPCAKVYEDELVFAFMDAGQVNPGHVIVATRKPYETLIDADEASVAALLLAA
jgi:hypothetical protein